MVLIAIMIWNFSCIPIIAFSEVSTYLMYCFTLFVLFMYVANDDCATTRGSITFKFILLVDNDFPIHGNKLGRRMFVKPSLYFRAVT